MNRKLRIIFTIFLLSNLGACVGNMNPTGGNGRPDYPYYITTQPIIVKNIAVPTGTTLEYEQQHFKSGPQDSLLNESEIIAVINQENQYEKQKSKKDIHIKDKEKELEKSLGLPVTLRYHKNHSGTIQIHFSTEEDFNRIINKLI